MKFIIAKAYIENAIPKECNMDLSIFMSVSYFNVTRLLAYLP